MTFQYISILYIYTDQLTISIYLDQTLFFITFNPCFVIFVDSGMHVAFAMTGNRVEKTLRKAGLRKFIGEQWFFPTVEDGDETPVERITWSGTSIEDDLKGCLWYQRNVGAP